MIVGKVLRSFNGDRRYEAGEWLTATDVGRWRHNNKRALNSLGYIELYSTPIDEEIISKQPVEEEKPKQRGRKKAVEVSVDGSDGNQGEPSA